ncbi:penicillin-insensitive murein endopeptidase [Massilia glaciei]|uniref:Replication initiation protein n=1 Tax=Massilia glaciei TaxID=1524097 RepID=A0A2U2HLX1_9BURK|nr:penicillin-insensitive murein endopeptidase [Massilia glaciei]PWF48425.1 replication initiation protein [Massilia glaciei]
MHRLLRPLASLIAALPLLAGAADSVCFGTSGKGRLEGGVRLPAGGANFAPYSTLGVRLGRTHVHAAVARTVVDAYAMLALSRPATTYVYGETGWAGGGRIRPHRTHQNGSAVDFMVPVLDPAGRSVPLPSGAGNKYGYAIEFDAAGRYRDLRIDFEAVAAHLAALQAAVRKNGIRVERVIIEPAYIALLGMGKPGASTRPPIPFMRGKAWIRHDEHYHVDFALPCRPLP